MNSRTSVGDGFRVSESSTPSNSSGGSEPDDIESLSDVYIWGEIMADGVSPHRIGTQVPSKIDVLIPRILESNVIIDVHQIASGTHHHAIVTMQGDVFTWGEESGGRLGHGIDKSFGHPHLVKFLISKLDFVACGEYHTCAISKFEDLFTWGDGEHNVGLLGHGTEASHWIPKRVDGPLEGLQVVSIACGTWHTALATSNGKLFTFGDGAFGVLGHGDKESVLYPKEVQLLNGLKTIKVACGAWHTAAIIEVMFQSAGSNASSWKLFTWGDGDKYRLGHGNKETYLQPTRVSSLIEYNFHEIACGHTMTIALTTSGHVFTMGGTENGQLGNPAAAGKVPTLVQDNLLGEFVEEISCGAHHVAVLTSKSELYTWGKGANGRLGHGDIEDRKSPSLVVALKDRHIKSISCGSNCTSCICTHKLVSANDQSVCSNCRQAFGLTRKRHNCNNCGLAYCHACSSKKAFKAILAPSPEKPHRVCDNCYAKLKVFEVGDASKFNGKATIDCSIHGRDRLSQREARSTRTLLSPITEPVKYLEIKNNTLGTNYGSISFIRASQVPSHLKLKDIAFPSSLSSIQSVFKPPTSPSPSQTPPTGSSPTSSCTSRPSPHSSTSPRFSRNIINSLRRTNNRLNQEVSNLKYQIQNLKQIDGKKDVEIQKLQRKATEAIDLAAVESSSHRKVKEFIESTIDQLKKMTEKLPLEVPESEDLRTMYSRGEDFLKDNSKSKTSSMLSMLEFKQQSAPERLIAENDSSKLQENRLEENVNAACVEPCQDGKKYLDEINGSTLECKKQNSHDIPTSNSGTLESQENILEENSNATGVDPCHDGGKYHDEIKGSTLEYKQQNSHDISTSDHGTLESLELIEEENVNSAGVDPSLRGRKYLDEINESSSGYQKQNTHDIPTSDSYTSESQEHILEENVDVAEDDDFQDGENFFEEINGSKFDYVQQKEHDILRSYSGTYEPQEHKLEENFNTTRAHQSQNGRYVLRGSNASSVSSLEEALSPQSSENGSTSLESSKYERQQEDQIIEKFESGVYAIIMFRSDGIKIFKRVKFSKRRFTENQAEEWWKQNKGRVLRKYCPIHQIRTYESSNITPHAKETIDLSTSKI